MIRFPEDPWIRYPLAAALGAVFPAVSYYAHPVDWQAMNAAQQFGFSMGYFGPFIAVGLAIAFFTRAKPK